MSQDRTLFLLDSAAAARAMLGGEVPPHVEMLATRYSAVDFLAARGIACRDCSEFITAEQAASAIRDASVELDALLARLDRTVGEQMCSTGGLPRMALFHAYCKYLGQYNLAGIRSFERVLAARLASGDIASVRFFHALATSDDPLFSFVASAAAICRKHGIAYAATRVSSSAGARAGAALRRVRDLAIRALHAPELALTKAMRRLRRWRTSHGPASSPLVVLFDPHDHSFFETALSRAGTRQILLPSDGRVPDYAGSPDADRSAVARMQAVAQAWLQAKPADAEHDLERLLVSQVVREAHALLLPLVQMHRYLQSHSVSAAAWDLPLSTRPQLNLTVELLLASGVPVFGRQHGANYVDQDLGSIHFDSDFNRCTHYFSYGFAAEEFAATYPSMRPRCQFIPAGNPPLRVHPWRRRVDIVFPITNGGSLFYLARMPEHDLAQRQLQILHAMDARADLDCVVKPPPHYLDDEFSHTQTLRRLRHVRVTSVPWSDYLQRNRPRLAVFEVASTPLFEALPLDIDLLLMLDPVFPFTPAALAMLRKRVHIFASAAELAQAIRDYGVQAMPRLRDQSYYDTYVNRGSDAAVAELLNGPALTLQYRPIP
jgi:hypothetical protein